MLLYLSFQFLFYFIERNLFKIPIFGFPELNYWSKYKSAGWVTFVYIGSEDNDEDEDDETID